MGQSLSKLYVHLIFSTRGREPLLLGAIRSQMHAYLAGVFNNHHCPAIKVGGCKAALRYLGQVRGL
jgi:putative transposase